MLDAFVDAGVELAGEHLLVVMAVPSSAGTIALTLTPALT